MSSNRVTRILALILLAPGMSIQAQHKVYTIENCVNQLDMDKVIRSETGYRYWFADKDFIDGRTLKISVVGANQATHPPHAHEVDEFFFVLEGTARFYLDGDTAIAGPYTSFYCPPGVEHGISNAGDTELKYLVIKKYPPVVKADPSKSEHWGVLDHSWKELVYGESEDWYASDEAVRVAENVLLYQRDIGGWPKNAAMQKVLTEEEKQKLIKLQKDSEGATIDNGATIAELDFLSKIYAIRKDPRYKTAFLRGIEFLLDAQYENGGWPQLYPVHSDDYSRHITYNDNAMVNVMNIMKDLVEGSDRFSIEIYDHMLSRAGEAFDKGLDCILKTQYRQNGVLTAWCAQHDAVTLQPVKARSYELPSLSGSESVEIVELLMEIDDPSEEVIHSIQSAIKWFEKVKITGIRIERFHDEQGNSDRRVVEDKNAPPLWARFYNLSDNKAFFCDRDGIKVYSLAEIGAERRNGYSWYIDDPIDLLEDYQTWLKKHKIRLI